MDRVTAIVRAFINVLCFISMALLAALMLLGTADVVGRYFFNRPISGAYEISEVILAGIVLFALAYTASQNGHVSVDTFINRFTQPVRDVLGFLVSLLSLAVFAIIGWQGLLNALTAWQNNRLIDVIDLPMAPFILVVPIGCLALCLELALQAAGHLARLRRG